MNLKENMLRSKEVLAAYFRQGAHELGAAFYPSGTAAQHPEYGMAFTRTPGEIADGMRGRETDARDNVEPSQLQQLARSPSRSTAPLFAQGSEEMLPGLRGPVHFQRGLTRPEGELGAA